jgi:SAM-dependent methyltransferase
MRTISQPQLLDTQAAFDSIAAIYDGPAGNNDLVQSMRAQLRHAVETGLPPGGALLDLGCGTGLDTEYFARAGWTVTAIDWAAEMVTRTQARLRKAGLLSAVCVKQLGIHQLGELDRQSLDGAYSNLGPLNCVPDLVDVSRRLYGLLKPGGLAVLSVMGRWCLWEFAYFVVKGDWRRATFRFGGRWQPAPLNGLRVWTRYYGVGEFTRVFTASGFSFVSCRALGLATPPPYLQHWADQYPNLIHALAAVDQRLAGWAGLRELGDHFLVVLRRQ